MLAAMPAFPPSDPGQALVYVALGVVVAVVAGLTWWQLVKQVRRHGGGWLAAGALGLAILGLLVAIAPNALPFEIGIVVLILALAAMYRPDLVVKATGGPSLRYRALREGRELQLLVLERGGWSVARRNEEVKARVEGLAAVEGPGTERYISLVRETVVADPEAPGSVPKLAELVEAEAQLRASLGARPIFDRELDRRAAALEPEPALEADPEASS